MDRNNHKNDKYEPVPQPGVGGVSSPTMHDMPPSNTAGYYSYPHQQMAAGPGGVGPPNPYYQPPPPAGGMQQQQQGYYGQPWGPPAQEGMHHQQAGGYMPQAGDGSAGFGMMGSPPPPGGQMMTQQQAQQVWMQRPAVIPGCPPGLEYLTHVDQILVHQQIELLEVFTNWETKNKYQIKNAVGQQVYYAAEESDVCARQCCGPQRGFTMHITENMGGEVIRVVREFKCCAGPCCFCSASIEACAQEVIIEAPPGQVIGRVKQECSCMEPNYSIQNEEGTPMLQIRGPICICQGPCCTWDLEFKVFTADMSQQVGRISKQWSGFVREYFTDADNFGVSFPMDLDVKMKATMIGAVFLIDFMFFENNQQNQNN